MDHRIDAMFTDEPGNEGLIAGFSDDERHALRDGPRVPRRKIVEDNDAFTRIEQLVHHVAADIAGPAGDQDCHAFNPFL